MRVLFCSTGGTGHLRPMRPLAMALQRLGHPVGWVTAPDALRDLAGQGLTLFAAGPTIEAGRRHFHATHPEIQGLRGERLSEQTFPGLFAETLAPAMLDDIGAAVDLWQPDLVVLEPAAFAAPLVCQLRGLPYVTHGYGLPVPSAYLQAAMRRFGRHWETRGLQAPADGGLYRHLYIHVAPPSLSAGPELDGVATLTLNPYATMPGEGKRLSEDLRAALTARERPRIYLTFGTVFHRQPGLDEAVQALVDLGAEVVVTVGPAGDDRRWGSLSQNLHARRFVDQAQVLPYCDAVVSHGGAGTVLTAAAHGLPQLILPQAADHFRNARALAAVSAGIAVPLESQTADIIRSQTARLLASASHVAAATRLACEMNAMPVAGEVARALEVLVSNGWNLEPLRTVRC